MTLVALLAGGLVAGMINSIAGGGSLITLPLLVLVGLPPTVANATNRLAVAVQSLSGVAGFGGFASRKPQEPSTDHLESLDRSRLHLPWPVVARALAPTLAGSIVGALLATRTPDEVFRPILGAVLLVMACVLALRAPEEGTSGFRTPLYLRLTSLLVARVAQATPRSSRLAAAAHRRPRISEVPSSRTLRPNQWLPAPSGARPIGPGLVVAFFLAGLYGGFIQAGVGFMLLAALVPGLGLDLVRANGVKVALVLALTLVALVVFVSAGQVDWRAGGVLALGTGLGGYMGARLAMRLKAQWIRWVVFVMAVACALEILGVRTMLTSMLVG